VFAENVVAVEAPGRIAGLGNFAAVSARTVPRAGTPVL